MNIVLIGFMGTGKTAVGEELARRLGRRYVDTDDIIQRKEGRSIPEIFAQEGEEYFRRIESEVIREISELDDLVISAGGGAVLREDNIKALRKRGILICLKANPEVIWERTKKNNERPLLEGFCNKKRIIKELLKKRAPFYNKADITVDTSFSGVSETVDRIVQFLSPEKLWVKLKDRGYPVFIGSSIDEVGKIARNFEIGEKVLIISDTNVFPLYGRRVKNSLEREGFWVKSLRVPPGERSKSLSQVKKIYNFCLEAELDRTSSILALGGGVVGDLAGFAAATFLRGINFLMAPTTLLSQVDSGVGGKVGVNLPQGKNLVGAFYQPHFVLIDPSLLRTLVPSRVKEGLAEVIKCAIIENDGFFSYLEGNAKKALKKDFEVLKTLIIRAVKVKVKVVEEDEREERGVRQILNLGHTIAHAIEKASRYGRYTHGEAVAIGLVGATKIGKYMGIFPQSSFIRVKKLLETTKLPTKAKNLDPKKILNALKVDKKIKGGRLFFVLPEEIGRVCLRGDVPYPLVEKVVKELVE